MTKPKNVSAAKNRRIAQLQRDIRQLTAYIADVTTQSNFVGGTEGLELQQKREALKTELKTL
jgi:hypothetical protein